MQFIHFENPWIKSQPQFSPQNVAENKNVGTEKHRAHRQKMDTIIFGKMSLEKPNAIKLVQ